MGACAVIGGQFGSEGKGLIVSKLAGAYNHHVRVGAANAGHTFYTIRQVPDGPDFDHFAEVLTEKHVMQQLPCAAYANPDAELYIGPGALISPEIFQREMEDLDRWRQDCGLPRKVIRVDPRAHVITEYQVKMEAQSDLEQRIGSTSATAREGIGWAQADRVMRSRHCVLARDYYRDVDTVILDDVPSRLYGEDVLLEGTQGTGLSLTTGFFPFTTSRNTTVAGLCADAGFAPSQLDRIVLVCRTFPIRVAGNSGPFYPDSTEIGWDALAIDPDSERTTVTRKVRRVATFSMEQLHEACVLNAPTEIALTFCDYVDKEFAGREGFFDRQDLHGFALAVLERVEDIEAMTGVPVTMLGTGPNDVVILKRAPAFQD